MRASIFLSLALAVALCLSTCYATDLVLGTSVNNTLVFQQKVKYEAVNIKIKEKILFVFYSSPEQQIIKGIIARDLDYTKASASVIEGGVGYSFCYIRLKSVRGFNYQIEIYA